MFKIKITIFALIMGLYSFSYADSSSTLGIDYLKITKNEKLAVFMLEMEPRLIKYYQSGEWAKSTEEDRIYALKGTAVVLSQDRVSESTYNAIKDVAPDVALKFMQLDKEKYPNLWNFGDLMRLDKELEDSKWMYRALHGHDYEDNSEK